MVASQAPIDVDVDRDFQEKFWIVVRIGWCLMLVLVIAAVLGLTGSGGKYSSRALPAGEHRIDVPAVSRWAASDTLTVTVDNPASETTVLVPAEFGEIFTIEAISPQPSAVVGMQAGDLFTFAMRPGDGDVTINFAIRASAPAWQTRMGEFLVNGERSGSASVTVLP